MKRIHFFEIEDQAWVPAAIRDGVTDFLRLAVLRADLYKGFAPKLNQALQASKATRVVDLCSGAGSGWESLRHELPVLEEVQAKVVFTDFFPNIPAFRRLVSLSPNRFEYVESPVSALEVPTQLKGFRTIFSAFHHFRPQDAAAILKDAVAANQGVAIAESTQRHPLLMFYMLLTPLFVWLSTPLQRPFKWSRLFWTYVVPAIPFIVMFDGLVSCLRTYTPAELMRLVESTPGAGRYEWETGLVKIGKLPVGVTYLIGVPRSK